MLLRQATAMGLNDCFLWIMVATGGCTIAAFFVGRDPVLEKARRENAEQVIKEEVSLH
jgi:hypothetical protein